VTKGLASARLVNALPQTRVCVCDRPAAFSNDHGICCKCGHRAEPEPRDRDHARVIAGVIARVLDSTAI
jgi:hypothetical protein